MRGWVGGWVRGCVCVCVFVCVSVALSQKAFRSRTWCWNRRLCPSRLAVFLCWSAEIDPNTGRPAVAVNLHLKVRMDIAVLLEVLGNFAAVQREARDESLFRRKDSVGAASGRVNQEKQGKQDLDFRRQRSLGVYFFFHVIRS